MKPKKALLKLILLLLIASGIQSCKKSDTDNQAPSIVVLQPNSGDPFSRGSNITMVATFHDYIELGKYNIEIKWNTNEQNISPNPTITPWDYFLEEPISGNNKSINKTINVPEDIRLGNYDLILSCFDKAGNAISKTVIISIAN